MSRMIRLYPRAWRDRYEAEFTGLLAECPPGPSDTVDIVRGAIDARLHPQIVQVPTGDRATSITFRLGGILGVVGGALWIATALAMYSSSYFPGLGYKDTGSAMLIAVAAGVITGLSAVAISRSIPGARSVMRVSAGAIPLGGLVMAAAWPFLLLGFFATIIGTMLFGLAGAALRLGATASLLSIGGFTALLFNTEDERALYLIPLGVTWVVLGVVVGLRGVPTSSADEPVATQTKRSPLAP